MMTRRARSETIHWTKKREPNVTCPRKPIVYHRATEARRLWLIRDPPDPVTQHPRLEPPHAQKVANPSEEAVPDTVLRVAVSARPVAHGNLRHTRAAELAERGKEAMRAREERQSFQGLAPVGLERAA